MVYPSWKSFLSCNFENLGKSCIQSLMQGTILNAIGGGNRDDPNAVFAALPRFLENKREPRRHFPWEWANTHPMLGLRHRGLSRSTTPRSQALELLHDKDGITIY